MKLVCLYRKEPEWDIAADNILMKSIIQERNNAPIHANQEKMRDEAKVEAKQNKKRIEEVTVWIKGVAIKYFDTIYFD